MGRERKKRWLYVLLVMLPCVIGSVWILLWQDEQQQQQLLEETKLFANIHKNDLDRFLTETTVRLETLAIVVSKHIATLKKEEINDILQQMQKQDVRFQRISFVSESTNATMRLAKLTKQTIIDSNRIPTIITPIINEQTNETVGFFVAELRTEYMKHRMKIVYPNASFRLYDEHGAVLLATNKLQASQQTVSVHLNQVPWTIEANVPHVNMKQKIQASLPYILSLIVIIHIIWLFIQYSLLKRQTIVERMETEAQKLELIGTLAASTAHEIRNPLAGIKGFIQLLSEKHKDNESQLYFSVIQNEITRINDIVNEFLILGKPTAQKLEMCDLNHIVQSIHPMIESQAHFHNVIYSFQRADVPLPIRCSKDHLKQVVLNLAKNAIEAMPHGGELTISLEKQGNFGILHVKDTGSGIPKHVSDKLFQPFVTSKQTGTGLGLVVCKRIIDMHEGTIDIHSIEKKGTTITVRFPLGG
ncbi:Stand-alone sensor domain-containing protein [Anoxybacillus gonensis]|uniref:histidine kinase n=1 Tax=Anoxybacillus gonensis TaxID=198467 RepID=A0AAW7TL29_9BACL|nr:ATP-binding protein [Anoxybacillus gonensis]AKS37799.1 Stand-alone sensor domain-containing protein [Anoxybacillus gonensis]KGP61896.1 Stand-alone sensor domain-containing protein [Anoxybacillus gonensis]MCX8047888.1 ATP-binding protein [Anoxybacillus gonensis]MDO0877505.1 ATP-binding protein [Anoxybacillus gonensis]